MKTLLLLIGLFLCMKGNCQWTTAERIYKDSEGIYLISYYYNARMCSRTLIWWDGEGEDPNSTQYNAWITVYQFMDNDTVKIGDTFGGKYSPSEWGDKPQWWVEKAKEIAKSPKQVQQQTIDAIKLIYGVTDTIFTEKIEPTKLHFSEMYKEGFREWLSEEWQSYKQDCWNDSTWVECDVLSAITEFDKTFMDRYELGKQCDDIYWLHKKPSAEEFLDNYLLNEK